MKKILLIFILILSFIAVGNLKIGAKMSETTEVRAEHILVQTKEEALKVKEEIEAGKITFEDAAKKYSMCPSKANGGDLGYFGRGMMVKPFEDGAFDGEIGKVSEPVQTQFGYHLIKVIDKR